MTKRIVLAALLGGVALFLWEFVAHMMTPLGQAGVSAIGANEAAVRGALKQQLPQRGLYYFPAPEDSPGMTSQQKKDAMTKAMNEAATGPTGLLMFQPNGGEALSGRQLATQFAADVVSALIAALLLAWARLSGFGARLLFVTALGLVPGLRAQLPLWNWYGFPASYMAAQITVDVVGFLLAGLIVAKLVQSRSRTMAAGS